MGAIEEIERQIRKDLDDWSSWLVYADWLTERDDARGQAIRLAHRLKTEALSQDEASALRIELRELEGREALLEEHPSIDDHGMRLVWQHGFVVGVDMQGSYPEKLEILRQLAESRYGPLLARVSMWTHPNMPSAPLSPALVPLLARCVCLCLKSEQLDTFGGLSLPDLERLELVGDEPGQLGLEAFHQVEALRLRCTSPAQLDLGALPRLSRLYLDRLGLPDEQIEALVRNPGLGRLSLLHLGWNALTDRGVEALASSEHIGRLERLSLAYNHLTDDSAVALARLPSLTALDLSFNEIGEKGAAALAASTLVRIDLRETGVRTAPSPAIRVGAHDSVRTFPDRLVALIEQLGASPDIRVETLYFPAGGTDPELLEVTEEGLRRPLPPSLRAFYAGVNEVALGWRPRDPEWEEPEDGLPDPDTYPDDDQHELFLDHGLQVRIFPVEEVFEPRQSWQQDLQLDGRAATVQLWTLTDADTERYEEDPYQHYEHRGELGALLVSESGRARMSVIDGGDYATQLHHNLQEELPMNLTSMSFPEFLDRELLRWVMTSELPPLLCSFDREHLSESTAAGAYPGQDWMLLSLDDVLRPEHR